MSLTPVRAVLFALTALIARPVTGLGAEPAATTADTIREVRIDGLRRVDREAVAAVVKSKVGQMLDAERITQDLHAIWKTGLFRDVRIERETLAAGVRLVITVAEKPSIKEIKYVGNDDVSADDIKGVVDLKPYTILNTDLIKKNAQKIRDLYVEKGHYLVQVDSRVEAEAGEQDQVTIYFDIVENAKVMVREIRLVGNKNVPAETIKSSLQTREGSEISFLTQSGTYKEEFFQTDLFRIQALYYDYGYVSVKVGEPSALISADRRFIYLTVPIEEGEKYQIGDINFSGDVALKDEKGATVVDEAILRSRLRIKTGETFSRTKLFEDIQTLTDAYKDRGYAYANVTPNSNIDPKTRKVALTLEVERGSPVYFERIEIVGNTRTRDKVIRRELRVVETELYSSSRLNESKARVYQLGYFETVNMTTSRGSKPDRMNVSIEIKEKPTGTFQVGVGFSSVESFIMTMQVAQNNFLGTGQLFSVSGQLSFGTYARQLITLSYYEPYLLDTLWSAGMDAYVAQRLYIDFQRNSYGGSPRLAYPLTLDWRVNLGYTIEHVDIINPIGFIPSSFAGLTRRGINSMITSSIQYDTRDNRLFPSAGQFHVLSYDISHPDLGTTGDLQFQRLQLFLRYYHPLPLGMVFKVNAQTGLVWGGSQVGIPISERFAPGGIYSVRGYVLRGLGPTVPVLDFAQPSSPSRTVVIGGNKQAIFNVELEIPLIAAAGIKGVIFADAGNAYNEDQGLFFINTSRNAETGVGYGYLMRSNRKVPLPLGMYYSFGFGFRWFSPIGPLRFEWGIPIVKVQPTDQDIIFEFTIGNFF